MENRFGVKDAFLFLLLATLGVIVVLAMFQFDRQYDQVLKLKDDNQALAKDLNNIKGDLRAMFESLDELKSRPAVTMIGPATGGPATGPATAPLVPKVDAFTRLREAEERPDFARGDWLIDNFGTKIGRLTPIVSSDVYQRWVEYQVLDRLCDSDPSTFEAIPRVASRWTKSDDGLVFTFYLRRGVEFSDGTRMTADDVVFTFDWIRNPKIDGEATRSYLTKLKEVTKIDDYTVRFTFSEFYYLNFDTISGIGILPKHFYSKYTPEEFNEKPGLLMGSGPYRLESPGHLDTRPAGDARPQ